MINKEDLRLNLEVVKQGYANGVAPGFPFTEREKWKKQQYQGSGAEYNKKAPVKFS